jgi:hypothetical protein
MTRRAMALIEKENYAEAQWYWVTNNMKEPNTPGLNDWWSGVGDHATSMACKDLFQFTTTYKSLCGSEFCPLPAGIHGNTKGYEGIFTAFVDHSFNQLVLNEFFSEPMDARCHLHVPPSHAAGRPDAGDVNSARDLVVQNVLSCGGTRTFQPRRIVTYPPIFRVYSSVHTQATVRITKKPVAIVHLGGREYKLGALLYSINSATHFACRIFVQGKVLFYDGMK